MATCDSIDVDLTPVDFDVTICQTAYDVEIVQTDVTLDAVSIAGQGPKGDKGDQGEIGPIGPPGLTGPPGQQGLPGAAATLTAGATVTTAPGTNANVTNSGSSSAAVFNFAIPRGDVGATGQTGQTGQTGPQGIQGPTGPSGSAGATGPQGPQGATGANASAVSTTSFTVPAVGATATVTLADASWVVVGQMLYADTAGGGPGLAGALQVTAKAGNVLTLLNPPSAAPLSSLGVFIETPSNKIYVLDLNVPQSYTITKLSIKTVSGTCTASFNRNGTAISGAGSIAVSSTLATIAVTQTCSVGDVITLVISANSSAADLSASVWIQP